MLITRRTFTGRAAMAAVAGSLHGSRFNDPG